MSVVESRLRRLAAALDGAALEALASKGLLRRAHKDLERGSDTRITGETATALLLVVGEYRVTLPETGPATAACSCPAVGVCQHILTAVLFLQRTTAADQQPSSAEAGPAEPSLSPEAEFAAITAEQLEAWAGKAAFKLGLKWAAEHEPVIVRECSLRIRFATLNSEVHFVPGGGLDGTIVSGGKAVGRELVVAAVIAFQRSIGKPWPVPAAVAALEAAEGAPRSRSEVLASCQRLLDETLNNGLARLSSAHQQRWATLAVSALGVSLPRLALALRGVGDETALALARDARGDLARLLVRMAQVNALCTVLQHRADHPPPEAIGVHRTRYEEVGHLDLAGAAAWPWRTASGYEGLTVLFWDSSARHWTTWTDSRPRHQLADFKARARYTQPGPWEGAESPRHLARSSFRLLNARRNAGHRLSGSSRSRVLVTGPANLSSHGLAPVQDWQQLLERSNSQAAIGLKEPNPLEAVVAIKPTAWGQRDFDPVTQVFSWGLADAQQCLLLLELSFDDFTEPAIKFLEDAPVESMAAALVIGRLQRASSGPSFHPYSIHRQNGEIIHLCLDNARPETPTSAATTAEAEEETFAEEEEAEVTTAPLPALNRLLDEVEDGLLALAETGLAALHPLRLERLRQVAPRAERLGLEGLTAGLVNVIRRPQPQALLRCAYLSQLHRRAMPLSVNPSTP